MPSFTQFINSNPEQEEIFKLIKSTVGGKWQLVESRPLTIKMGHITQYVITLYGKNVMSSSDHYVVRVFVYIENNTDLFYCIIRGDRSGSIERLPSFAHSMLLGMEDIANSINPLDDSKRAIKSPKEVAEFIEDEINKWYWKGENGKGRTPVKPFYPGNKKPIYSLSS